MKAASFVAMTLVAVALGNTAAADELTTAKSQERPVVRLGTMPQEVLLTKITVSNLPKSYDFYTRVIGLKLVSSPDIETAKAPFSGDPEKDFVEIPLNFTGSMADPDGYTLEIFSVPSFSQK